MKKTTSSVTASGIVSVVSVKESKESVHSSLITIYTADSFVDPNEESVLPRTPDSEKEDLDDLLNDTTHLFINNVESINTINGVGGDDSQESRSFAAYSIEDTKGQQILIARQVEVGFYDQGRLPISYDVYNRFGHLIFTTDGRETMCGMEVFIKGHGEVIRGKVTAEHGIFGYDIRDFLTGKTYCMSIPWWMVIFTCMLYCFHPSLRITSHGDGKLVATIGTKKWVQTSYDKKLRFALCYDECTDPDTKLFLFSAALVIFHLYFKNNGKRLRCLTLYVIVMGMLTLLVLIGVYIIFLSDEEENVDNDMQQPIGPT